MTPQLLLLTLETAASMLTLKNAYAVERSWLDADGLAALLRQAFHARKYDLLHVGADKRRDLSAGGFLRRFCALAEGMLHAMRVAVAVGKERQHDLQDARVQREVVKACQGGHHQGVEGRMTDLNCYRGGTSSL